MVAGWWRSFSWIRFEGRNEGRGCWIGRFNWTLEVRGSRSSFVEFDKVG